MVLVGLGGDVRVGGGPGVGGDLKVDVGLGVGCILEPWDNFDTKSNSEVGSRTGWPWVHIVVRLGFEHLGNYTGVARCCTDVGYGMVGFDPDPGWVFVRI